MFPSLLFSLTECQETNASFLCYLIRTYYRTPIQETNYSYVEVNDTGFYIKLFELYY